MTSDDRAWSDKVADAAKDVWVGVESAAIIASAPAATMQENNVQFNESIANAAVSALADSGQALSSAVEARGERERIAEDTDVSRDPETSLTVEPPSWMHNETELAQDIGEDLASAWSDAADDLTDSDVGTGLT